MHIKLSRHLQLTDTAEGGVLLDKKRGKYWQLNPTATYTVHALIAGSSVSDITSTLAKKYRVSASRISSDINSLIEELAKEKIIRK